MLQQEGKSASLKTLFSHFDATEVIDCQHGCICWCDNKAKEEESK